MTEENSGSKKFKLIWKLFLPPNCSISSTWRGHGLGSYRTWVSINKKRFMKFIVTDVWRVESRVFLSTEARFSLVFYHKPQMLRRTLFASFQMFYLITVLKLNCKVFTSTDRTHLWLAELDIRRIDFNTWETDHEPIKSLARWFNYNATGESRIHLLSEVILAWRGSFRVTPSWFEMVDIFILFLVK